MNNYNSGSYQTNSMELLGVALTDGLIAGLIGGILGVILPILGLLTANSSMISFGFFVNIFLYLVVGILAGYLFHSRKLGHGWVAGVAAVIAGIFAGAISGAATGLAFSQVFRYIKLTDPNLSRAIWIWSIASALGAAFIGVLTAWIPGFFLNRANNTYNNSYSYGNKSTYSNSYTHSNKSTGKYTGGTKQSQSFAGFFEERRKRRFLITMTILALMFGSFLCRLFSQ